MRTTTIPWTLGALLLLSAAAAFAQDQGQGQGQGQERGEHRRGRICANAALSEDDKAACMKAMRSAQTPEDRKKVRDTYEAKIKAAGGNQ